MRDDEYIPVHEEALDEFIPDEQVRARFIAGDMLVVTAPRPIPGQYEWRGGGGAGYFYAALPADPDGPHTSEVYSIPEVYAHTLRAWSDLHATPLRVFSEDEVWSGIVAHLEEEGMSFEESAEFMDLRDWRMSADYLGLPAPRRLPR